jgi:hypothetical protein
MAMSWREVLGIANSDPYPQYPHNSQNPPQTDISADIAEEDSSFLEVIAAVCRGLPITPMEVRDALSPDDIDDWRKGDISTETLATFSIPGTAP